MEDEDRFGSFWDSLDEDEDDDSTSNALVEQKPMLPEKQYTAGSLRPQATNSIKIERKTPLDYMIRKNQQLKMSKKKSLPTYNDYQQNIPTEKLEPVQKSVDTRYNYSTNPRVPTHQQTRPQTPPSTQQPTTLYPRYQINEKPTSTPPPIQQPTTLYPRYQINEKPATIPPPHQDSSYLRSQMLKELQSQQSRQPVNLSRSGLQPPTIQIPPSPVRYSQEQNTSYQPLQPQSFIAQPNTYPSYYEESEPEKVNEVELMKCLRNIQDKTKIDVIIQLLDGDWHPEGELIRIAKKTRDFIGVVGFSMLMCSFEDTVAKSFLVKRIHSSNSTQFKINDNYIELARSAYSHYKSTEN